MSDYDPLWQHGVDKKLNKLAEDTHQTKVHQAEICGVLKAMKDDLRYHIKRTDLLEERHEVELQPISQFVDRANFFFSMLKYIASLGGLIAVGAWLAGVF